MTLPEASAAVTTSVYGHGASGVWIVTWPRLSISTGPTPATTTVDRGPAEPAMLAGKGQIPS